MKLFKIIGLGFAATALASWIGTSTALAKPDDRKATGKDCVVCHGGPKPYKKDKLTDKGKAFQDCKQGGKTAGACKAKVN
jgi:hypothetical protein